MNRLRILVFGLLLFSGTLGAQIYSENPSKMGIGFNVGFQKPYCDVPHTGAGLAAEAMARFILSPRFNLSVSLGYGLLNDGFVEKTFQTNLLAADLKANINLFKPGQINPYILLGIGVVNFEYTREKPYAIGSPANEGKRFFDGSFIYGGGLEYMINRKTALNIFTDYRFSTGDALDGAESGDYKDGYLNTRMGLTFYMGDGPADRKPDEDLLALEPLDLTQLDDEPSDTQKPQDNLQIFETKIDNLEREETNFTMEHYVRLKSRVDELNRQIENKNSELQDLRSNLVLKNNRIAQLESNVSTVSSAVTATSGEFSADYEQALRLFYSRDYAQAIQVWDQLKERLPNHKLSSNSQYWIGEAYFGMGQYENAAQAFQNVFNYEFSYKKDDATLMLGRTYLKLGDTARARSYFQGVIDDYPQSEYVEKAREWLQRIG